MSENIFFKKGKSRFLGPLMGVGVFFASFTMVNSEAFAQDIKIEEWKETKEAPSTNVFEDKVKSVLPESSQVEFSWLHNDGEPIDTNILSGDTDFYLEAVSKDVVNGKEVIDYFFNQVENEDRTLEDIEATVLERKAENEMNSATTKVASVANPVIRNFNWSFNSSSHYLTTSVEMSRKSSKATIDGKKGSVWDIVTNTQYERKTGLRYLNDLYTRLAIPYSAQTLLDWGPNSTSSSTVGVSLSGAGIATLNYSFSTGVRYNTVDLSSKSSKYGRWKFTRAYYPIYANRLVARPAIRATNTSGPFSLQLSHSLEFDNVTNNTGVITINTPDR